MRPEDAVEDGEVDGKVLVDGLGLGGVVEVVEAGVARKGSSRFRPAPKLAWMKTA